MIKFGTSGFRGIIGDTWTKENAQRIAFALRSVLEAQGNPVNLIVGYDNRFMARESAMWFCEAICCDKIRATFIDVSVSTPYIAYKTGKSGYGIIITASHNSYVYNGIKIFLPGGREANDEFFTALEKVLDRSYGIIFFEDLVKKGYVKFSTNIEDYIDRIVAMLDVQALRDSNLKILVNPMHGSGAAAMKRLFERIGLEWHAICENPDPYFGFSIPSPYPYLIGEMAQKVKGDFSLGLALDADADRVTLIDYDGKVYTCSHLGAVLHYYLTQIKKQYKGGIVKNFLTGNLVVKLCQVYGFEVHETPVGFKFIGKAMEQSNTIMAVESNNVGFKTLSLYKDGIAGAMLLAEVVAVTKKSIGQVIDELAALVSFRSSYLEYAYPFHFSVRGKLLEKLLSPRKPGFAQPIIKVDQYFDGYKLHFAGDYWCGARMSANEDVMRFYIEMADERACHDAAAAMEKFYGVSEKQK